MTDNAKHPETNGAADSAQERFSEAYRRAMDGVTMSPQLRERVLRLQNKKPEPMLLRVIRPVACAAACLAVVFAAKSWIKTEQFSMDTATTETAARAVSSEAVSSSTYADYAPETAAEAYGAADIAENETESAALTAEEGAQSVLEEAQEDNAVQKEQSGAETPAAEPYVLSAHTDLPAEQTDGQTTEEEASGQENIDSRDEKSEPGGGMTAVSNPLVSYDSVEEAAAVLSWAVKLPPLPEDFSVTLISGGLLQIDWNDGKNYYRMAGAEFGADISGDYNSYPAAADIENGYSLRLRGDAQDAYRLLTWEDGGYSYAYYSDAPLTMEEAKKLVEQILGY